MINEGLPVTTGSLNWYVNYTEGRRGRGMSLERSYCQRGLLGIRLILVGCEGSHIVERSCFYRSQFNHSDLSILSPYSR